MVTGSSFCTTEVCTAWKSAPLGQVGLLALLAQAVDYGDQPLEHAGEEAGAHQAMAVDPAEGEGKGDEVADAGPTEVRACPEAPFAPSPSPLEARPVLGDFLRSSHFFPCGARGGRQRYALSLPPVPCWNFLLFPPRKRGTRGGRPRHP